MSKHGLLHGNRFELRLGEDAAYPETLARCPRPPKVLYGIGNPAVLQEGLAVIGARRATPYGRTCAYRFAHIAAQKGIVVISGGARGCDSEAHRAALDAHAHSTTHKQLSPETQAASEVAKDNQCADLRTLSKVQNQLLRADYRASVSAAHSTALSHGE